MKYKHLFFDLDHTLWDFDTNARNSLAQLYTELKLEDKGVYDFNLFYENYLLHNEQLWAKYRKGAIRQDELRVKRMRLTLLDFKIGDEDLAIELSTIFLKLLPTRTALFPDAKEVLHYLANKGYALHMITNGFEEVQHNKLKNCGLSSFFGVVITSEGSNSLKPQKEIFEFALQKTGAGIDESIMIGDALDVDILGARNIGMDGVHVNFDKLPQYFKPTYTVNRLKELEAIF
jgi:putative hydrolase of the HAD superfamily